MKTFWVLSILCIVSNFKSGAQSVEQILLDLKNIDTSISAKSKINEKSELISNRAMNLFLSDRIGYYLGNYENLSFYKNNITLSTDKGIFSLNHNLFQAKGIDENVKNFNVIGVRANIFDALLAGSYSANFTNQLGVTFKRVWIAKPKTKFDNPVEKQLIDVHRHILLHSIEKEIREKEIVFKNDLENSQTYLTDSTFQEIKQKIFQRFYNNLRDEQQSQELIESINFHRITTHWTNLSVYLPVALERNIVAKSLSTVVENRFFYPMELLVSHTRFLELKKTGRFFFNVQLGLFVNNTKQNALLKEMSFENYQKSGGVDTLQLRQRNIKSILIGDFNTFLTLFSKIGVIFFPKESHIGFSASVEQNFGEYNPLNFQIGVPVVLIDNKGVPSANFEFQVKWFDYNKSIFKNNNNSDNISINLTLGIPFSKIIY
jgi:hypothetical protein